MMAGSGGATYGDASDRYGAGDGMSDLYVSANRGLPRLTMAFAFSDQATLAPPRLTDAIFSKMCRQSASQ
jgi:hypothetical protein